MTKGRKVLIDPNAASANLNYPAFLSPPEDALAYHGFPIIEETNVDGWRFGAITEFIGDDNGDGFVVAPDGSRAGLVWQVGTGEFKVVLEPDIGRWGVYAVWFPSLMNSTADLIANFKVVLPSLEAVYTKLHSRNG